MGFTLEIKNKIKNDFENLQKFNSIFVNDETDYLDQFASLLNNIYEFKFPNLSTEKKIKIESKDLIKYSTFFKKRYISFNIKKKDGTFRQVSSPQLKLKTIQQCLNELFSIVFIIHDNATGFIPNKSIVDNAKIHVNNNFVFNTDLENFFNSIKINQILRCFKGKIDGTLAILIANLCCDSNSLPQGAPTSPILSNIVCYQLDLKLTELAKLLNASYSRYADDITFSSNNDIFDNNFINKLNSIIEYEGCFKINIKKQRIQRISERQIVTGIKVNQKCNLDRKFIKDIRFWIMCWNKFGFEATQNKFIMHAHEKKGYAKYYNHIPSFVNYIRGKILYLGMVRNKNDKMYLKFNNEFKRLQSIKNKNDYFNEQPINLNKITNNLNIKLNNKKISILLNLATEDQKEEEIQFKIGNCYESFNIMLAIEWYKKSAEKGYAKAQHKLGDIYFCSKDIEQNKLKAIEWYKKSAEQGYVKSQHKLGDIYFYGENIEQDILKAIEWYKKSALQGYALSQHKLGNIYFYGKNIEKDKLKAIEWYKKSALQGYTKAIFKLGVIYYFGDGLEKDKIKGFDLLKKSSKKGYLKATYKIKAIKENGSVASKNPENDIDFLSLDYD